MENRKIRKIKSPKRSLEGYLYIHMYILMHIHISIIHTPCLVFIMHSQMFASLYLMGL